jgi:predicted nucleotidyltransferase
MSTITENRRDVFTGVRLLEPQLKARGVKRLALFGSFARDTPGVDSDVDFLIEFFPGQKNFDNFFAVGELLEATLGRRIELLTPESLSPHIGPRILQEAEDVFAAH